SSSSFFFHHPALTQIYTLSLHDALPISPRVRASDSNSNPPGNFHFRRSPVGPHLLAEHGRRGCGLTRGPPDHVKVRTNRGPTKVDRKSTRLNSSHVAISYAVFCLKKKKT